jgi:hypothetical protein
MDELDHDTDEYDPVRFEQDLRSKGALRECPACGATDWQFPEDGVFVIPGTVSEEGVDHRVTTRMECAPVICGNCDFVRFHVLGLYL